MNFRKIILIIALVILALILVVAAFLSNPKNSVSVSAQEPRMTPLICDEPIPVGIVIEKTSDLMNDIYMELFKASGFFDKAVGRITTDVAGLSGDEICDYSKCRPKVVDAGAKVSLDVDFGIFGGQKSVLGLNIPYCNVKNCEGNPCPNLTETHRILGEQRAGIQAAYDNIHKFITKKTELVTEDIRKKDGAEEYSLITTSFHITRPEVIKRWLQVVREWLSPSTETGKQSCALSNLERKRVADGTAGNRFPMRCADALSQYLYWPKAWSEKCDSQCKEGIKGEGIADPCIRCLGDQGIIPQTQAQRQKGADSALAKINSVIYGWTTGLVSPVPIPGFTSSIPICGAVCSDGELDKNCAECLSKAANIIVTSPKIYELDAFTEWICGKRCEGALSTSVDCSNCFATTTDALARNFDPPVTVPGFTSPVPTCNGKCENGKIDKDCADCLRGTIKTMNSKVNLNEEQNFTAWICGGNYNNYVCCHEAEPTRE